LVEIVQISEKGRRSTNEDYIIYETFNKQTHLVLIADGMGGYEAGDVAAKTVSISILEYLRSSLNTALDPMRLIRESCLKANQGISEIREVNGNKMGATIAGILFMRSSAFCFWLGDVRIIHFRNNQIQFQSKDHSLVNELKEQKKIIDTESYKRINHIVTKALQGNHENPEPDIHIIKEVSSNDRYIICSDGVHNVVGPKEIELFMQTNDSPQALIDMIRTNCDEMGNDNYSLAIVSI
jgi:serine/threonine protein phosphatase PrpC